MGSSEMDDNSVTARSNFGFRTCISSGWAVVRDHWVILVFAVFLRELLSIVAAGLIFCLFVDWRGWNMLVAMIARCIVWSALEAGYLRLSLELCQKRKTQLKELFSGLSYTGQMFLATICLWLAVILGLVVLIVPGLIFIVRYSLYGYILVDQRSNALKSFSTSSRMLKGYAWCAAGLISICSIGIVFVGWLSYLFESLQVMSLCILYLHLRTQETDS